MVLICIVILFSSTSAWGASVIGSGDDGVLGDLDITRPKYKGQGILERMIAGVFTGMTVSAYELFGIQDPLTLIFDYEPAFDINGDYHPRDELYLGIYTEEEMEVVTYLYNTFEAYIPIYLLLAITGVGLLLVFAGFGGDPRMTAKQYIWGILVALFLLAFGPALIDFVFDVAYLGADIAKGAINKVLESKGVVNRPQSFLGLVVMGILHDGTITQIDSVGDFLSIVSGVSALLYSIIFLLIFIAAGLLNWQYIIRKITLGVLIFSLPLVAAAAVFPNTRGALKIWFSEFLSNAFLVTAHAIVYGFLIMMMYSGGSFGPLETIIFLIGLNGTVALVRKMFGAPEGKSDVLRGAGAMLGISSLMGVGQMALGGKGGISSLKEKGQTAQQVAQAAGQGVQSAAGGDVDKIAQSGKDLTTTEAGIMQGQQIKNTSGTQDLELDGPQKHLDIQQEEPVSPSFRGKVARAGGAVAVGSMGALASGLVMGNSGIGFMAAAPGYKAMDWGINSAKNIKQARSNPASMGIYDAGQIFDAKSASEVGRRIAGSPGAAAGSAVSKAARFKRSATSNTPINKQSPTEQIRGDIDKGYQDAQQNYSKAEQNMQLAQYDLQQVELKYPANMRQNDEFKDEHADAAMRLEEAKREFNQKRLWFKEAENIKNNEHDYIGIQLKMDSLKKEPQQTSGRINKV